MSKIVAGITAAEAAWNMHAALTGHEIVPVESCVTGETVAHICLTCETRHA